MIENGHSALESPRRLRLERLNHFSTNTSNQELVGETNNWESPSLQSCNSHLSSSHLSNSHLSSSHLNSSQSTALRSLQPPDLGQWPLMQVILKSSPLQPLKCREMIWWQCWFMILDSRWVCSHQGRVTPSPHSRRLPPKSNPPSLIRQLQRHDPHPRCFPL